MPRRIRGVPRGPHKVIVTPPSRVPYILTDTMREAITTRGSCRAEVIRALAQEFEVPFYWMRDQVLALGAPAISAEEDLAISNARTQAFLAEVRATETRERAGVAR